MKFSGPFFIFGMPRSGTKLLRDLLNRNEKICVPLAESHFIPYLVNKYGLDFDFSIKNNRKKIYRELVNTSYYFFLKYLKVEFEKEKFLYAEDAQTWADFFEYMLKKGGRCQDKEDVVYGDKTPGYIKHMTLLKKVFPECRFIHIVRDPRDYVLSCRKAWNKNIYRAAERWRESLERFERDARKIDGDDISVVYYEDLLDHPEEELKTLCLFLGVEYNPCMLRLDRSWEFYGDARSKTVIVKGNKQKYLKEFRDRKIKRIEEIVYPTARKHGYEMYFAEKFMPLRMPEKIGYKILDSFSIIRHNIKKFGVLKGMYLSYIHHKKSSWQS